MNTKISKTAIAALIVSIIGLSLASFAIVRVGPAKIVQVGADAIQGVCSANDPMTQLCNIDISLLGVGTLTIRDSSIINGLSTIVSSGSLGGYASTTILSLANPNTVTSTVDFVQLIQTAVATTTYTVGCGTSTVSTTLPGASILSSGSVSTGTLPGYIQNGITAALGASISGGSIAKIMVGPTQYLNCVVTPVSSTLWTSATQNSFAGTYKVRWLK